MNSKTEEVVERLGPMEERKADRVEGGMNINLNHAEYFTRIVPEEPKSDKKAAKGKRDDSIQNVRQNS